jgi:hypothetical protein
MPNLNLNCLDVMYHSGKLKFSLLKGPKREIFVARIFVQI